MPIKVNTKAFQKALEIKGVKQEILAKNASINKSFFSQIINGIRGVSSKNRKNIEKALISFGFKEEEIKDFFRWVPRKKRVQRAS